MAASGAYRLPTGLGELAFSRLLTLREKYRLAKLFTNLAGLETRGLERVPLSAWIDETAGRGNLAKVLGALFRVSTYIADHDRLSAAVGLEQLKSAIVGNVWYVDGGWQSLVDGLGEAIGKHGGEVRVGAAVRSLSYDSRIALRLSDGQTLDARAIILAVDPKTVCEIVGLSDDSPLAGWQKRRMAVRTACLDVALSRLPRPAARFALGLDQPTYFSVHSGEARLAEPGIEVIHVMKYLSADDTSPARTVEAELEAVMARMQPGWTEHVVARRFLPSLVSCEALPCAADGGYSGRPSVELSDRPGVYLAGDWVGDEGHLADAAVARRNRPLREHWPASSGRRGLTKENPMRERDPIFEEHRQDLARLAYRMLGSLTDSDDVLQEAYLRWSRQDRTTVRSPRAYLTSVVTRLCIDQRRTIEARKETYVGPWLPEPVVERGDVTASQRAELAESLSLAFLIALETLTPLERAAYLLRQTFDFEYDEIAAILDKSADNCRQLVSRAQAHLRAGRPRFEAKPDEAERITAAFLEACASGELNRLVDLLASDAVLYSDGGGKVLAALAPIRGADRVGRFFLGVLKKSPRGPAISPGGRQWAAGRNGDARQPGVQCADARRHRRPRRRLLHHSQS